jgi:hypothetical protein
MPASIMRPTSRAEIDLSAGLAVPTSPLRMDHRPLVIAFGSYTCSLVSCADEGTDRSCTVQEFSQLVLAQSGRRRQRDVRIRIAGKPPSGKPLADARGPIGLSTA